MTFGAHDIVHGDVLATLRELPDNTFDGLLCDPPYGFKFMGKKWDYDVPSVEVWREAYRVLKPGAALLSFGGARTFHRIAIGIEDAGFELRDVLSWNYAKGFPKSLNVAKAGKDVFCDCDSVRCVRETEADVSVTSSEGEAPHVLEAVQREAEGRGVGPARPQGSSGMVEGGEGTLQREDDGLSQSGLEGRSDDLQETRELCGRQVRQVPAGSADDGASGRLRNGASSGDGTLDSTSAPTHRGASRRSRSNEQREAESGAVAEQPASQAGRVWPQCDGCGKPIADLNGYGTALKPAWEPIILARKPLEGTVAGNVAKWGTGGLAIDACRIERDPDDVSGYSKCQAHGPSVAMAGPTYPREPKPDADGRWPANLAFDDGAAAILDAEVGNRPSRKSVTRNGGGNAGGAVYTGRAGGQARPDSGRAENGGPSRFFFCAKVSTKEREFGCEGLERKSAGEATGGRKEGSAGLDNPRAGAGRTGGARNHHPTLKPLALTRWLSALIKPPTDNAVLLVPYSGAGSEMIGALQAGRPAIFGIEGEVDYVEIAKARIEAWGQKTAPTSSAERKEAA